MLCFFCTLICLMHLITKPEVLPIGAHLPPLDSLTADGPKLIQPDSTKDTIIVLFHPRCKHCIYQLRAINDNIVKFLTKRIYLLTTDKSFFSSELLSLFPILTRSDNVSWGIIQGKQAKSSLGSTATPQIFIFDSSGCLVDKIRGESKLEYILKKLDGPEHRVSGIN